MQWLSLSGSVSAKLELVSHPAPEITLLNSLLGFICPAFCVVSYNISLGLSFSCPRYRRVLSNILNFVMDFHISTNSKWNCRSHSLTKRKEERGRFHRTCITNQWIISPFNFLESSIVRYLLCFQNTLCYHAESIISFLWLL